MREIVSVWISLSTFIRPGWGGGPISVSDKAIVVFNRMLRGLLVGPIPCRLPRIIRLAGNRRDVVRIKASVTGCDLFSRLAVVVD